MLPFFIGGKNKVEREDYYSLNLEDQQNKAEER